MGLVLLQGPADDTYPITLDDAKAQLRRDGVTAEEDKLEELIPGAVAHVEDVLNRAALTQRWTMTGESFSSMLRNDPEFGQVIRFPKAPLKSVLEIRYVDADGVTQVLSSSVYEVNTSVEPGIIRPLTGECWPNTKKVFNAVEIDFECGYGLAAAVPGEIKLEMMIQVADKFIHRNEKNISFDGVQMVKVPNISAAYSYRILVDDSS